MDLLETTLQVIENRNLVHENLTLNEEDLKQYENYLDELKEHLQALQSANSLNEEILEANNFTKNAFNENYKLVKDLFGKVYNYTQQMQESLSTIAVQKDSLEELYNENVQRCTTLEQKYVNDLKLLDILEKDSSDKLTKENLNLQMQLQEIDAEYTKLDESFLNIIDEQNKKSKRLQTLTMEVETLQGCIDTLQAEENLRLTSIQQQKEENQKKLQEIIIEDDEAVDAKIAETQKNITIMLEHLKKQLEIKEELLHDQNEAKAILEKLNKDCIDTELLITETEETSIKMIEELTHAIDSKKKMINEQKKELSSSKDKAMEFKNEIDQLHLKIDVLNCELNDLKTDYKSRDNAKEENLKNLEKTEDESKRLIDDSEKLSNRIANCKNEIHRKKCELQLLESTPSLELLEIQKKMELLESEHSAKKLDIENEILEIDSQNKYLQQTIEQLQSTLKDLNSKQTQIEAERDQNQEKLKVLNINCELISSEILENNSSESLETIKQENKTLTLPLPLERLPPPQSAKKRRYLDTESDSSIDGERLTYAEFMARKKIMKELKKTKKNSK